MAKNFLLGISCFYHDSAAALISDGEIISAVQEERFTRIKNDSGFPRNAIKYCLESNNLDLNDIENIIYYEKPLLTFERLLESYLAVAPRGGRSFISAMQVWLKEKLFLKSELKKILKLYRKKLLRKKSFLYRRYSSQSIINHMLLLPFSQALSMKLLFYVWMV